MLRKINEQATLELKSLVIAETVVPYQDLEKLAAYVKQVLDSTDVITEPQKQAIMVMVHLAPMEASINKEETGDGGTLRNSAVIALFKRHLNNVHFMLIGYTHQELPFSQNSTRNVCGPSLGTPTPWTLANRSDWESFSDPLIYCKFTTQIVISSFRLELQCNSYWRS